MEDAVESDLSALHRVDDMWTMGSRRWARLVPNLVYYAGAVQGCFRLLETKRDRPAAQPVESSRAGGGVGVAADGTPLLAGPPSPLQGKEVGSSPLELKHSDIGDMFSFG